MVSMLGRVEGEHSGRVFVLTGSVWGVSNAY